MAAGLAGVRMSPSKEIYSTTVGEIRKLPLADGSTATINTSRQLSVLLELEERRIILDDGETWFEVAHNAKSPFIVSAGDVHVRAIGTAFSVRRHRDGIDVLVTQGAVETWKGREADRTPVLAGQRTFIPENVSRWVREFYN